MPRLEEIFYCVILNAPLPKKDSPKGLFGCIILTAVKLKRCIYLDTSLVGVFEEKLIFSVKDLKQK